ncbi:hypothetical protein EON81_16190 [bacterium]|nr:MAG: hypothetical protein EON81_16190 [bacterium]
MSTVRRCFTLLSLVAAASALGQTPAPRVWRYLPLDQIVPANVAPNGRYMIQSVAGTTRVWDLSTLSVIRETPSRWEYPAALSFDGQNFIGSIGGTPEIRRVSDFSLVSNLSANWGAFGMSYAPDGSIWAGSNRFDGTTGTLIGPTPFSVYGSYNFGRNGKTVGHTVLEGHTQYPAFYNLTSGQAFRYANGTAGALVARGDVAVSAIRKINVFDDPIHLLIAQRTTNGAEIWRFQTGKFQLDNLVPLGPDRILLQVGVFSQQSGHSENRWHIVLNANTGQVISRNQAPGDFNANIEARPDIYEAILSESGTGLRRYRITYNASGDLVRTTWLPPVVDLSTAYLFRATNRGVSVGQQRKGVVIERGSTDSFFHTFGPSNIGEIAPDGRSFYDSTRGLIDTRTGSLLAKPTTINYSPILLPDGRHLFNKRMFRVQSGQLVPFGPQVPDYVGYSPDGTRTLHLAGSVYTVRDDAGAVVGSFERVIPDTDQWFGAYLRGDQVVIQRSLKVGNAYRLAFEYWRLLPEGGAELKRTVNQPSDSSSFFVFGPGGRTSFYRKSGLIATGKNIAEIRRTSDGKVIATFEDTDSYAPDLASSWSPDGSTIYLLRKDGSIVGHEVPAFLDEIRAARLDSTTSTGRILLTRSALAGGTLVELTSSSTKATVPATVLVPGGKSEVSFAIETMPVTATTRVNIKATLKGESFTIPLDLLP